MHDIEAIGHFFSITRLVIKYSKSKNSERFKLLLPYTSISADEIVVRSSLKNQQRRKKSSTLDNFNKKRTSVVCRTYSPEKNPLITVHLNPSNFVPKFLLSLIFYQTFLCSLFSTCLHKFYIVATVFHENTDIWSEVFYNRKLLSIYWGNERIIDINTKI